MITSMRMKNFKSWQDSGEVKLAPLTGFFGTNSSGKSSLLQMLLLLKQTIGRDKILFFGDENSLVNLGNFREVIHGHRLHLRLGFELACKLTHPRSIYNIPEDSSPWEETIDRFVFNSVIQTEQGQSSVASFSYGNFRREEIVYRGGRVFFPYRRDKKESSLRVENCYGMRSPGKTETEKFLRKFSAAFEELFAHVYYLGPTRVQPKRRYHWAGTHPKDVDLWGDKAIDALLSARARQLKTVHQGSEVTIEDRVSAGLQKMELAHSFSLSTAGSLDDNNYEVRIQKSPASPKVTLVDMGYGLADLLPMLIYCYYVPEGSTLILEQPGVHLHPKVQSQFADLLIEVVTERKLQILVESHSEHLLNRLQRRIAEEKISVNKTALYFCRNDKGVSNIERLKMDEFGNIKNWPENFFGNEMDDLFAMTDAQRERQKRETGLIEGTTVAPSK